MLVSLPSCLTDIVRPFRREAHLAAIIADEIIIRDRIKEAFPFPPRTEVCITAALLWLASCSTSLDAAPFSQGVFFPTFFRLLVRTVLVLAQRQVDGSDDIYSRQDIYLIHDNTGGEGW